MSQMLDAKRHHRVPPNAGTVAMWLVLAALTMLFGASMLAYAIIRFRHREIALVHLPQLLWLSTAIILFGSVTIHRAVVSARRERQTEMRQSLLITCILAVA